MLLGFILIKVLHAFPAESPEELRAAKAHYAVVAATSAGAAITHSRFSRESPSGRAARHAFSLCSRSLTSRVTSQTWADADGRRQRLLLGRAALRDTFAMPRPALARHHAIFVKRHAGGFEMT